MPKAEVVIAQVLADAARLAGRCHAAVSDAPNEETADRIMREATAAKLYNPETGIGEIGYPNVREWARIANVQIVGLWESRERKAARRTLEDMASGTANFMVPIPNYCMTRIGQ